MSTTRTLSVWLLLAVLMTGNGIARELVLVPQVGSTDANVLSAILGIGIILGVTGLFFQPLVGAPTRELARTSAILAGLTVAFELLFGHYVDGKTWSELIANYAIWNGRLWPVVLASIAIAPFLWGRWVKPRRQGSASQARIAEPRAA